MAKIDNIVSNLKKEVEALKSEVSQINFNVLRVLSGMNELTGKGSERKSDDDGRVTGGSAVDLGPIEERLEELTRSLINKKELVDLSNKVDKMASERIKEAEETIKKVTKFLETGLEMVKIEATLEDVKSLLSEIIIEDK